LISYGGGVVVIGPSVFTITIHVAYITMISNTFKSPVTVITFTVEWVT